MARVTKIDNKRKAAGRVGASPAKKQKPQQQSANSERKTRAMTQQSQKAAKDILAHTDLMGEIFSFLDVKDLHNLSMTNKELFRSKITYERVVRSAVLAGGSSKKSMGRFVGLMEARRIFTPSPLRMLRLLNGKRCELCNTTEVKFVQERFGLYQCYDCTRNVSTHLVGYYHKWNPYIEDSRVPFNRAGNMGVFLWQRHYKDGFGETCGPYAVKFGLDHVILKAKAENQTPKEALDKHMQELEGQDQHASSVNNILSTFRLCEKEAERRKLQAQETATQERAKAAEAARQRQQQRQEANEAADRARKEKIQAIVQTLVEMVGEVPWKGVLTSYRWVKPKTKTTAQFTSPLVEELLRPFVLAPSKATNKKLVETATALKDQFGLIFSTGFHDHSFLSASDPFEDLLLDYCRANNPQQRNHMLCDSKALGLIRQGKPADALYHLHAPGLRVVLVGEMVAPTAWVEPEKGLSEARRIALGLWELRLEEGELKGKTLSQVFTECRNEFPALFHSLKGAESV